MGLSINGYTIPPSSPGGGRRTPGIRANEGGTRAARPVEYGFLANLRVKLALGHGRSRNNATLSPPVQAPLNAKQDSAAQARRQMRQEVSQRSEGSVPQSILDRSRLRNPQGVDVTSVAGGEDRGQLQQSRPPKTGIATINTNLAPAESGLLSRLIQRTKVNNRR